VKVVMGDKPLGKSVLSELGRGYSVVLELQLTL
jgi:hypothetical protein